MAGHRACQHDVTGWPIEVGAVDMEWKLAQTMECALRARVGLSFNSRAEFLYDCSGSATYGEARRLSERFEWHYTPKHGSWLDMAESELGVLATQCLNRRVPDKPTLIEEVAVWQDNRNRRHVKADWQLTTDDARVKLKRLYPLFQ
jgi:hypothetical protein